MFLTTLLLFALPAQATEGKVHLGIYGGWYWPNEVEDFPPSWVLLPRLGLYPVPRVGLEFESGWSQGVTETLARTWNLFTPRTNLVFRPMPSWRVEPFVAGGVGLDHLRIHRDPSVQADNPPPMGYGNYRNPDTDLLFDAGPGLLVDATWRVALRADLRFLLNVGSEPFADLEREWLGNWELTGGLLVRLGGQHPDLDRDGILNEADRCPEDPEDFDGFEDADGCPDPDNDQDRILDVDDRCPDRPEDRDGFEDADGCPDPDNDQDGVPDVDDRCPLEPGPADNQGCPAPPPPPAEPAPAEQPEPVEAPAPVVIELPIVHFAFDSAALDARARDLLDEAAAVLREHPDTEIEVVGHTDGEGSEAYNDELGLRRARAVADYLARHGVDRDRMSVRSAGERDPVDTNDTEGGRARNRRVELHVVNR